MIAALYVEARGVYAGLPDVDLWAEARDARLYPGPHPVVAHPPCARWCRLSGLVEARYGYRRGDDGGTFAAALAAVRRWGGVLEHPAYTRAWPHYGLPVPPREGWGRTMCGGWVCYIEQGRYGHPARKATWLYAVGTALPSLRWGLTPGEAYGQVVSWCGNRSRPRRPMVGRLYREEPRGGYDERPRLSKRAASATPLEFRDLLILLARSVEPGSRASLDLEVRL